MKKLCSQEIFEKRLETLISGRHICYVVASVVGAVASSAISSKSASKASKAQTQASRDASESQRASAAEANELQREQFQQNRTDGAPYRYAGEGALNQLSWKLGIKPRNSSGYRADNRLNNPVIGENAPDTLTLGQTKDPLWERILSRNLAAHQGRYGFDWNTGRTSDSDRDGQLRRMQAEYNATKDSDPEFAAYKAKIDGENARREKEDEYEGDPTDFGSLTKSYSSIDPYRKFSEEDYKNDFVAQNGLQFGLDQGTQGLERQASANGSQLSGATLKALTRFGNDYGTRNTAGAYDRYNSEYTDKYNRYNSDQASQYNRLAGIAGTGQQQVNQIGQAGQNYASQVGANNINASNNIASNTIGAGNARASSYIARGNALNNAFSSGYNNFQQNRLLNNRQSSFGSQQPAPVEDRTF